MFGGRSESIDASSLGAVEFFAGFSESDLLRIAELADSRTVESGAVLMEQGRVGLECFVIRSGRARVFVGDEHVATLEPGSMVGEMALVSHLPRIATVVAVTPMDLVSFDVKHFRTLLEELPEAAARVAEVLSERDAGSASR